MEGRRGARWCAPLENVEASLHGGRTFGACGLRLAGLVLALDAVVERVGVGLGFVRVYLSLGALPFATRDVHARLDTGVTSTLDEEDHDAQHDRQPGGPHVRADAQEHLARVHADRLEE